MFRINRVRHSSFPVFEAAGPNAAEFFIGSSTAIIR